AVAGGLVLVSSILYRSRTKFSHNYDIKPNSFQLTVGSIDAKDTKSEVEAYYSAYNTLERGKGAVVTNSAKVAGFVDKFYSMVTDIYEWGWGQSFHFSPLLPGRDWSAAEAAHETRVGAALGLRPGQTALDVGCGVGGPMRTIAASSGAKVVGITINEYQVKRANYHCSKQGLSTQCRAVRGDFMAMPFEDASFDGAYAIEATCHAPRLQAVYSEVFRVLRPGAKFVSYEWVTTPRFNAADARQVAIVDEIVIGNGLPDMRSWVQAEEAGREVGFELLASNDLACAAREHVASWWRDVKWCSNPFEDAEPVSINPWYTRLGRNRVLFRMFATFNAACVRVAETLRLAPQGTSEIHTMLMDTAFALIDGGEAGIFTPMHMLVFQKPAGAKPAKPALAAVEAPVAEDTPAKAKEAGSQGSSQGKSPNAGGNGKRKPGNGGNKGGSKN
ncbi:hypothetical protein H632_c1280p0, partial [Helicosporidium sp. ATCC 50920]